MSPEALLNRLSSLIEARDAAERLGDEVALRDLRLRETAVRRKLAEGDPKELAEALPVWKANLHPRGRGGRFRETFDDLVKGLVKDDHPGMYRAPSSDTYRPLPYGRDRLVTGDPLRKAASEPDPVASALDVDKALGRHQHHASGDRVQPRPALPHPPTRPLSDPTAAAQQRRGFSDPVASALEVDRARGQHQDYASGQLFRPPVSPSHPVTGPLSDPIAAGQQDRGAGDAAAVRALNPGESHTLASGVRIQRGVPGRNSVGGIDQEANPNNQYRVFRPDGSAFSTTTEPKYALRQADLAARPRPSGDKWASRQNTTARLPTSGWDAGRNEVSNSENMRKAREIDKSNRENALKARRAQERQAYEKRISDLRGLEGEQVRLTWPNGGQQSGRVTVETRKMSPGIRANLKPEFVGMPDPQYVQVGSKTEDGSWSDLTRIEVKGKNGRYATRHDYSQPTGREQGRDPAARQDAAIKYLDRKNHLATTPDRISAARRTIMSLKDGESAEVNGVTVKREGDQFDVEGYKASTSIAAAHRALSPGRKNHLRTGDLSKARERATQMDAPDDALAALSQTDDIDKVKALPFNSSVSLSNGVKVRRDADPMNGNYRVLAADGTPIYFTNDPTEAAMFGGKFLGPNAQIDLEKQFNWESLTPDQKESAWRQNGPAWKNHLKIALSAMKDGESFHVGANVEITRKGKDLIVDDHGGKEVVPGNKVHDWIERHPAARDWFFGFGAVASLLGPMI